MSLKAPKPLLSQMPQRGAKAWIRQTAVYCEYTVSQDVLFHSPVMAAMPMPLFSQVPSWASEVAARSR